jgi:hypothetical protein
MVSNVFAKHAPAIRFKGSSPLLSVSLKFIGVWQRDNAPDCRSGVLRNVGGSNPSAPI